MIKIQLYDSNGTEVNPGDLLRIQPHSMGFGKPLTFYARLQVFNGFIYPFSLFAYNTIVKADQLPEDVSHVQATDRHPEYWANKERLEKLEDEGYAEKWRMNTLIFEPSNFYKAIP